MLKLPKFIFILFSFTISFFSFAQFSINPIDYTGQEITPNSTYYLSSDLTKTDITIPLTSKLIIAPGVKLTVEGNFIVNGNLQISTNAGVLHNGAITLGSLTRAEENASINLGKSAYLSTKGSLSHNGGKINMDNTSVVEVCGTYTYSSPGYAINYTGDSSSFVYFIVKAAVSGNGSNAISNSANIRFIANSGIANITHEEVTFCGPNATSATCPLIWPTDLDPHYTSCHNAPAIIDNISANTCTMPVHATPFGWSYKQGTAPSNPVTNIINLPGTTAGYTLDIYELDNSFNMIFDAVQLATQQIDFGAAGYNSLGINIRFQDGTLYNNTLGTAPIWDIKGTEDAPAIRIKISETGVVSLYGSKVSGGELFPLELFNGNTLNTITWNTTSTNKVTVTQKVSGPTSMNAKGYGNNKITCPCYNDANTTGNALDSQIGISLNRRDVKNNNWPMIRKGAHLVIESGTQGFVLTRMTTNELDAIKTAGNAIEGMISYDTTVNCIKLFSNGDWKCFSTPTCP